MVERMQRNQEKNWWVLTTEEVCALLKTDPERGLTQEEAKARLQTYGFNELPTKKRFSVVKLIINQFSSAIIWLLIAAIIIAAFLGEWIDTAAIAVIVFLNACFGFFQEFRAEKSLEALQKLAHPTTNVVRNGKVHTIPSREIVPGDLIVLEAGDKIAADGRIVYATSFSTQEAALTGESLPVEKKNAPLSSRQISLGDKNNMAFMGTVVVRGKGRMVVTATGVHTELGKIAALLKTQETEATPLQIKLNRLGHYLTWMCIGIVVIVFGAGLWRGSPFVDSLLIAVSLAVAAIPEGLPAVVTIALAMGVRRMAKRNALVRRLPSVETLGCATVICTDKTGTLTQNEMVVRYFWVNREFIDVSGAINLNQNKELRLALEIGVLCNNAELEPAHGDPTEIALLAVAKKAHLEKESLEAECPLKDELPFDSDRKIMSMIRVQGEKILAFVKGAPDVIVSSSSTIQIDGEVIPLDEGRRQEVLRSNSDLASQALRVLGLAYHPLEHYPVPADAVEMDLTFVGLVAMLDPPRNGVKEAIDLCDKAGIQIVMITGDHKKTAEAIARELNLLKPNLRVVQENEIQNIDDEELKKEVRHIAVYARTSAHLKLKIVRAWKKLGEIVAMTGDGVNDAPAIKEAHIGLAMGLTGTDVTREASDIIILDDNFATIVHAVEEGRGIYDNILKFVNYLLSCNIAELLIIFASILLNFRDPSGNPFVALTAVQLLWLNLITDGLPAIALSMDPVDPKAMERPPRKPGEAILTPRFSFHLFSISTVIALGTLIACFYGLQTSARLAYTMTFTLLVVLELVRVQMVRAQYHMKFFTNPLILIALGSSIVLQLIVVYTPGLQNVFETVPLGIKDWGIIIAIAAAVFALSTVVNFLFGRLGKKRDDELFINHGEHKEHEEKRGGRD